MRGRDRSLVIGPMLLVFLWLAVAAFPAGAEEKSPAVIPENGVKSLAIGTGALSPAELQSQKAAVESAVELGASVKKSIIGFLDQAIHYLESAEQLRQDAEEIEARVKSAPERIQAIQTTLNQTAPNPEEAAPEAANLETKQLELRVQEEEAALAQARLNLDALDDLLEKRRLVPRPCAGRSPRTKKGSRRSARHSRRPRPRMNQTRSRRPAGLPSRPRR